MARLRAVGWSVVLAAVVVLIGWPFGRLLAEAIGGGAQRFVESLGDAGTTAIVNSLWVSATVALLATAGGLAFALLTERCNVAGRAWLRAAIVAPLLIPDFVTAISWTRAWGPAGLSDLLLGATLPGLYGPLGIVLVLTIGALPLAYLVVMAGLRVRAEPDMERAARASGAGALTVLRTVSLPLLAPVLAAAAGLVFVSAMNAFGTPAVLGRPVGFATMTTRIYQDLAFSSAEAAFLRALSVACLLVVIAVVVVALSDRVLPRSAVRTSSSTGPTASGPRAPVWLVAAAWLALAAAVLVPLIALVLNSLTRAVGLVPLPENLTLANFGRALDQHALAALGNSLVLAVGAAVAAVGLGLLAAAISGRRWRARLGTLITLTFAVPGSVLAVAVLLAFGPALRDTLAIILLAYLAKLWALGHRPVAGVLDRLPADLTHAARASGAGLLTAGRTVLLPILAPALAAGWLLVFVFALQEVTISILLYGPATATLAVVILNLQQLGDPTVTSALAVLLTAFVALLTVALLAAARRSGWITFGTP